MASKTFMGVVHLAALPSAGGGAFDDVLEAALRDARALFNGGADAVMVENFHDVPFHKGTRDDPAPPDVPAALAVVAREVAAATLLPVGINCLRNDGVAALGAAAVAAATYVRINVLSGTFVTDQGVIDGEAARIAEYRRRLDRDVTVLADLLVKHARPLAPVDPAVAARDLAERSGADAIVVSGDRTGDAVDESFLRMVRDAIGSCPLWIGSGLGVNNAAALWPLCDGAIVGTSLKHHGVIDEKRVAELRALLTW